jgi:two-component system KDP operon response regulator KdpE
MVDSIPDPGAAQVGEQEAAIRGPAVVVIEPEAPIRRFLRNVLAGHDYRIFEAATARGGLVEAATRRPDLVLLDLDVPDMDGLQVLKELREWTTVPVIVLSASGQERDKIIALDGGADDYVSKPFSAGELLARMRAALRRRDRAAMDSASSTFSAGELFVDLARRQVLVAGNSIHLTPIEYKLLTTLIHHAGRVVTHRQLLQEVWGPAHTEDSQYLRVYVAQLRRKLEHVPMRPRYLLTKPGVGYRLAVETE